jgi:4-diphosphocytidyl-2-C-methyl-D-erythritol kinase
VKLPAPAKLNLFLHITGRREDGYHLLQTLFQLLDHGDELNFWARDDNEIVVSCPGLDLPAEQNLVYRAALALRRASGCERGADVQVDKRLPPGGGLGGGSSDAATTLLGLNALWQTGLDGAALEAIALQLGADVPLFVRGHSAWAEGVGELMEPVELPSQWYLVVAPACQVSTAEVFSSRELTRNTPPIKMATFFAQGGRNDCEQVVRSLHPDVDNLLIWLANFGEARLTGTGACCFLAFASEAEARAVFAQLPETWQGFVARGINHSPVHAALGLHN